MTLHDRVRNFKDILKRNYCTVLNKDRFRGSRCFFMLDKSFAEKVYKHYISWKKLRKMKIHKFCLRMDIKSYIVSKFVKIPGIIISAFAIREKATKIVIRFYRQDIKILY